jgi:hypothetical protein
MCGSREEMEKILKNINKEIEFSAQDKMRMLLTEEYHNAKIKMEDTVKKTAGIFPDFRTF